LGNSVGMKDEYSHGGDLIYINSITWRPLV
jgi:hypothetical protein